MSSRAEPRGSRISQERLRGAQSFPKQPQILPHFFFAAFEDGPGLGCAHQGAPLLARISAGAPFLAQPARRSFLSQPPLHIRIKPKWPPPTPTPLPARDRRRPPRRRPPPAAKLVAPHRRRIAGDRRRILGAAGGQRDPGLEGCCTPTFARIPPLFVAAVDGGRIWSGSPWGRGHLGLNSEQREAVIGLRGRRPRCRRW